jgi:hypothetical protein
MAQPRGYRHVPPDLDRIRYEHEVKKAAGRWAGALTMRVDLPLMSRGSNSNGFTVRYLDGSELRIFLFFSSLFGFLTSRQVPRMRRLTRFFSRGCRRCIRLTFMDPQRRCTEAKIGGGGSERGAWDKRAAAQRSGSRPRGLSPRPIVRGRASSSSSSSICTGGNRRPAEGAATEQDVLFRTFVSQSFSRFVKLAATLEFQPGIEIGDGEMSSRESSFGHRPFGPAPPHSSTG